MNPHLNYNVNRTVICKIVREEGGNEGLDTINQMIIMMVVTLKTVASSVKLYHPSLGKVLKDKTGEDNDDNNHKR